MNVLFVGNISSLHDFKWANSVAEGAGNTVYFVDANGTEVNNDENLTSYFADSRIRLLGSIPYYSFRKLRDNRVGIEAIKGFVQKYKIDIVHILYAAPHALWGLHVDVPYVISARGSDVNVELTRVYNRKSIFRPLVSVKYNLFRKALTGASAISATSQGLVRRISSIFQINSTLVIRTGVNVQQIERVDDAILPEKLKGRKFVFSPRWIHESYNIELQVEAIRLLSKELRDKYVFVFVRYKNWADPYLKIIEDGLKSIEGLDYLILDNMKQTEMWSCFKHASLTIMTPEADGTPNTALEAMVSRCPLILGNFAYDTDIFEGCCEQMETKEPTELSEMMIQALNSYPSEKLELAYQRVYERGNQEVEMRKIIDLYTQILGTGK